MFAPLFLVIAKCPMSQTNESEGKVHLFSDFSARSKQVDCSITNNKYVKRVILYLFRNITLFKYN